MMDLLIVGRSRKHIINMISYKLYYSNCVSIRNMNCYLDMCLSNGFCCYEEMPWPKPLEEERVYLALHFHSIVHHWRKLGQELKQSRDMETGQCSGHEGVLFICLLIVDFSACFFIKFRIASSGMASPSVISAHPNIRHHFLGNTLIVDSWVFHPSSMKPELQTENAAHITLVHSLISIMLLSWPTSLGF